MRAVKTLLITILTVPAAGFCADAPVSSPTAPVVGADATPAGMPAPPVAPPAAPPVTAQGEQAPPLRVPPPPQLAPMIVPALPPGAPSAAPGTLTIDQAVVLGLQRQPTIGIAQQSVESARGRVEQARSALGPNVSVGSSFSRNSTHGGGAGAGSSTSTSNSFNQSVAARQLLFDFGHTRSSVRAARLEEAAARTDVVRTRSDTVFDIRQAYFTLLEDQRLIDVAQQTVNAQTAHLDEANALFSAGKASQLDVLRAQTAVADAQLTLANARTNAALARSGLNQILGIDVRTPTQVSDVPAPEIVLPDMNGLVAEALDRRPEVVQARQIVQANEANLTNARTSNLPSLAADGSLSWRGASFPGDVQSRSIGLNLAWDPFDSGLTRGRVRASEAALATARLQLFQAQQTVSSDVTQAFLNVQNARQRSITSDSEVASAQEALNTAEGRYRAQVGIFLEVTDAQAALSQSQANQVNAVYSLQIALAALDRAVGRTAR